LFTLATLSFSCGAAEQASEQVFERIPAVRTSLQVTAQGGAFAVTSLKPGQDGQECIVHDLSSGKSLTFAPPFLGDRIYFSDHGRKFLLGASSGPEDVISYTLFNFDGEELARIETFYRLQPSSGGKYFHTVNTPMDPSPPLVYDSCFNLVKDFRKEVSPDWDAFIVGDTMYVMRDLTTVRLYRLPKFVPTKEYAVSLGSGPPLYQFYCNRTGTVFALSNYQELGLVCLASDRTFIIPSGNVRTAHIADDGKDVYLITSLPRGCIELRHYRLRERAVEDEEIIELNLAELGESVHYGSVDTVFSTEREILINLTAFDESGSVDGRRALSLIVDRNLKGPDAPKVRLPHGPSWPAIDGCGVYTLELSARGERAILRETRSAEAKGE
jgi:hypothetical protein